MTAAAEARVTRLAAALRASGTPDARDLAQRLRQCQQGRADRAAGHNVGWRMMCRSPACEYCRRWLATRSAASVRARFGPASNAECWHITVMLARAGSLDIARDLVRSTRRDLRNMRDRRARTDRRWCGVGMVGMAEMDALGPDDVQLLPSQRRAVVEALPAFGGPDHAAYGFQVTWVPHLHLAVHAPALARADLAEAFRTQWPGPAERADVSPFWACDTAAANAARIVGYGSKHAAVLKLDRGGNAGCVAVPWPSAVLASYWAWVHRQRNGLQMWRVMLGAGRDDVS